MISEDIFKPEDIKTFGKWCSSPFKNDTFDFKTNADFLSKMYKSMNAIPHFKHIPSDFVMFERNLRGLYRIFSIMEVEIDMRRMWIPHFPES